VTRWGWSEARAARRAAGAGPIAWLAPLSAAVPWVTVGLLLLMMHMVGGTLTMADGTLFDLPGTVSADRVNTKLVAVVMPAKHGSTSRGTLVFFDDARFVLGDEQSEAAFGEQLAERIAKTGDRVLLALADRRVSGGELMRLAEIARRGGAAQVLFAARSDERGGE